MDWKTNLWVLSSKKRIGTNSSIHFVIVWAIHDMSIHVLYMSYTLTSLRMFIGPYLHVLMYNMLMHLIQNPWIHWMTELDCTSINTFSAALGKRNMERASIWRTLSRALAANYHLYPLQHQGHPHLPPSNVLFFFVRTVGEVYGIL